MNRVRVEDSGPSSTDRRIREPEILEVRQRPKREETSESDEEDEEDNEVERRHAMLQRRRQEEKEEELLKKEDSSDDDNDESDDEEEYTSSGDEDDDEEIDSIPRLKPVFVRKEERITALERELEEKKEKERQEKALKDAEMRRQESLKIIESEVKREEKEAEEKAEDEVMRAAIDLVDTDDEKDEEVEYELWKVREITRLRRDKEERETAIKEEQEKERLRNMTEEERKAELIMNPKIVTNKAEKGDYKFMQKYFHRGAFYLDQEDKVFKRNFAEPTLEDHFDKSVLPSVMQVKNFGRSGRTKYTHLVDQDTTAHDSPWSQETPQTSKMMQSGGGFKPLFDRPSKKKKLE
jgi:microfibrillar-associated protein 1